MVGFWFGFGNCFNGWMLWFLLHCFDLNVKYVSITENGRGKCNLCCPHHTFSAIWCAFNFRLDFCCCSISYTQLS